MFLIKKGSECCFSERGHYNFIYPNHSKKFVSSRSILVKHISHWIGYDDMRPYIVKDENTDKKGSIIWTNKLNAMEYTDGK